MIIHFSRFIQGEKALGTIPLRDLTVLELDNEDDGSSPSNFSPAAADGSERRPASKSVSSSSTSSATSTSRKRSKTVKAAKVNRIALITSSGVRYVLQASSPEDRDTWVSQLKIASRLISD